MSSPKFEKFVSQFKISYIQQNSGTLTVRKIYEYPKHFEVCQSIKKNQEKFRSI